jgi:hypothetical protein
MESEDAQSSSTGLFQDATAEELTRPVRAVEVVLVSILYVQFLNSIACAGKMEVSASISKGEGFGQATHRLLQLLCQRGDQEDSSCQCKGYKRG